MSAVFLDRDGVLNVYLPGDYVKAPAELRLLPGVAGALRRLNDAGIPVFLVSNQQGVAKGLMTGGDLFAVDQALREDLASEAGATIVKSYYCTHAKADGCDCRKPQAGMLLQAAREHGIDLAASTFVGDTETDAQAAQAAGVGHFALVLTGKYREASAVAEPIAALRAAGDMSVTVAADLAEAVEALLAGR